MSVLISLLACRCVGAGRGGACEIFDRKKKFDMSAYHSGSNVAMSATCGETDSSATSKISSDLEYGLYIKYHHMSSIGYLIGISHQRAVRRSASAPRSRFEGGLDSCSELCTDRRPLSL